MFLLEIHFFATEPYNLQGLAPSFLLLVCMEHYADKLLMIPLIFSSLKVLNFIDHRLIRWVADNMTQEWRWQQVFSQIYVFTTEIRSESSQLGFRPGIARAPSLNTCCNTSQNINIYIYDLLDHLSFYFTHIINTHEVGSDRHWVCDAVDWIDRAWYDSFLPIGHGANKIQESDKSQFVITTGRYRHLSRLFMTGSPLLVPGIKLEFYLCEGVFYHSLKCASTDLTI